MRVHVPIDMLQGSRSESFDMKSCARDARLFVGIWVQITDFHRERGYVILNN